MELHGSDHERIEQTLANGSGELCEPKTQHMVDHHGGDVFLHLMGAAAQIQVTVTLTPAEAMAMAGRLTGAAAMASRATFPLLQGGGQ